MKSNDDSQDEAKGGAEDLPGQNTKPVTPVLPVKEAEERSFKVSLVSLIYRYLFMLFMTLLGVFLLGLLVPLSFTGQDYLVLALLAAWSLGLIRYWAYLLGMPHRILIKGDSTLDFISLFRHRTFAVDEVASIKVSPLYPSYLRIITSSRKNLTMINHIDGLHELIEVIKRGNPELETRGC